MKPLDRYAVIGNPITHSRSPEIHAAFAAQTGQHLHYERLLAPLDGFAAAVERFIAEGGKGMNVTVPFKLDAYAFATQLTERAKAAGAVNTLTFDGGQVKGDNTDGVGLATDLISNAGRTLAGKKILLLGAGGAARGVILPLLLQRPQRLVIVNRTHAKAEELVCMFPSDAVFSSSRLESLSGAFDIVVNATSASIDDAMLPIAPSVFAENALAYDMMYGAAPTVFMRFAAEHGVAVRDGLGMLVEQAAESFFVWRGVRPETAAVYAVLRAQLSMPKS